ncbi:arsenite S-adenosylmethyltransferase [Ureibacillus massiliensis 4400831 = CIP 108448 = CCUG 49529]|uniref:Arsenite methyltransferase n=1 Tax=Ureibacillus massiliensis 4400831 = CIP 108448 = CCUG 49529 TaxID=1211035 RepID=A0A0A3JS16_9BACL|nr:arsenite methyltransferase [Ureibacillus massiliensis]KGR89772.1 arsenite S-adenosylmethyltransferase [Ureibacillus massiliensis 4400831 = CIP 108448 = CCUG 49529]BDH63578.1 arsenite S-adenosylmethyltransferase [Lysinibacillus sp. PLM2]
MKREDDIRQAVRDNYTKVAIKLNSSNNCCAPNCCDPSENQSITIDELSQKMGYTAEELASIPDGANMGLSCGNPQAIADLKKGEIVVDLGSGGGFDCFLASPKVGPTGKVIGIDMTPEMISKARRNAEKPGFNNVEFRLGEIEHMPIVDSSVDVIISNCVINLSPNKPQVFKEAYRILKSGGRVAISDVILTTELPESYLNDMNLYSGCISGAISIKTYEEYLKDAGFIDIQIIPKDESKEFIREWQPNYDLENYIVSAIIQAKKA